MKIEECRKILNVSKSSTNDEIIYSYKQLAKKYHPDKNRGSEIESNKLMSRINSAYNILMTQNFQNNVEYTKSESQQNNKTKSKSKKNKLNELARELLIESFVKQREISKDALYMYFQYKLYNNLTRERTNESQIFKKIVSRLQYSYHSISAIKNETNDKELIDHFSVFMNMIYNFYRQSECESALANFHHQLDAPEIRLYKEANNKLHLAHKEIFFDQHNRGNINKDFTLDNIMRSELLFKKYIDIFSHSNLEVEARIKLDYTISLKNYFDLFFFE